MASQATNPGKLVLEPNVPAQIALKYPTGKIVDSRYGDEKQVYFSLADGRSLYTSLGLANSITNLQLGNREPFMICKRWNGSKQQTPRYDVWLTPEGEKLRAQQETAANTPPPIAAEDPPSELEQQLAASLAAIQARKNDEQLLKRRPPAPAVAPAVAPPQATGTHGPIAMPRQQQAAAAMPWSQHLLEQTNALVDIYAEACRHAETIGVPGAVVRTVMLSAFIGLQRNGGR
jgi:hypothetical protein